MEHVCEWCGKTFLRIPGPGRPRKYCEDACRIAFLKNVAQPDYYRRKVRRQWSHIL